jgi:hypothetical protein
MKQADVLRQPGSTEIDPYAFGLQLGQNHTLTVTMQTNEVSPLRALRWLEHWLSHPRGTPSLQKSAASFCRSTTPRRRPS